MCKNCNDNKYYDDFKYNGCGCGSNKGKCGPDCRQFRDDRREAMEYIRFDIKTVRCGIADIKKGIPMVCEGCVCNGIELIELGVCNFQLGLKNLCTKFDNNCLEVGCKSKRLIEEAICSLKEAICLILEGIEIIKSGCVKEGVDKICRGLCNAEEGLIDLEKALQRFC